MYYHRYTICTTTHILLIYLYMCVCTLCVYRYVYQGHPYISNIIFVCKGSILASKRMGICV